jgi:hypothetical protein
MVGLYTGWNYMRTGQVFLGTTGGFNYLYAPFDLAKSGRGDPFSDGSLLSITAKGIVKNYDYSDIMAVFEALNHDEHLDVLAIQKMAFSKFIETIKKYPIEYTRFVLNNCNPLRVAPTLFDPIATVNDFYQLGVPPFRRIVPGVGVKSLTGLAHMGDYAGLGLALMSLVTQAASVLLFVYVTMITGYKAARLRLSGRHRPPALTLALQSLMVFFGVVFAFALVHGAARFLTPVIPVYLLATAIALKAPLARLLRDNRRGETPKGLAVSS